MANLSGMDASFLEQEMSKAPYDWKSIVELPEAPRPKTTEAPPADVKLAGELVHFWQVRASTDATKDVWNTIPTYMWHAIDRELNCYVYTKAARERTTKKRIVEKGKDRHVFRNILV